jgi:hypothetical protein
MDLPKRFARRGIVFYLQIAAAVVSLLLGLAQMTKESQPIVQKMQERHQQAEIQRQQAEAQRRAQMIANMGINWQYRGNDGTWRYYSDPTGRYWSRVNIQGVYEYTENNQIQMASNPSLVR